MHGGTLLLLQHYHLNPDNSFASVDREPSLEKLEERYGATGAGLICFGHHHPVHLFRSADRVYLNPGSLGCCDRPVARYALVEREWGNIRVDLKEAEYDNRAFLASYERLGVPAREFILRIFHGNQHGQA